jgi:hypothetical protein
LKEILVPKTHFEQIPVEVVKKIVPQEFQAFQGPRTKDIDLKPGASKKKLRLRHTSGKLSRFGESR